MKKRDEKIELLRIVCIFVVILFHTELNFHFKEELYHCYPAFVRIITVLIWVAVCMFFFISGLVFQRQMSNNLNGSFIQFAKKKCIRLWGPYFLFTLIYSLNGRFFQISDFIKGGFWHLWFLSALFWCFIVAYVVRSFRTIYLIGVAVALSVVSIPSIVDYLGIGNSLHWFVYFVEGMVVARYHLQFRNAIFHHYVWVALVSIFALLCVWVSAPYPQHQLLNTLGVLSILPVIYAGTDSLNFTEKMGRTICTISGKTMGVYVIHYLVMIYLLSTTSMKVLCIEQLNPYLYLIVVLALSLINFGISYCITKLLQFTPLKKMI